MAKPHPLLPALAAGTAFDPGKITFAVVDSAIEHRVAGLLLARSRDRLSALPRRAAVALTAFDIAVAAQRSKQLAALKVVQETLGDVDHVIFKGIVSSVRWFDDPLHRPFSDIDVVVASSESLPDVVELLDPKHPNLSAIRQVPTRYSQSVRITVEGITVDLQSDPLRMGIGPNSPHIWWEATEVLELEGVGTMKVFDPDADLALFLLHQSRDRFRYLLGVAEAARRFAAQPDWERVAALARSEGIWDQVAVAAEVMSQELGRSCPVQVPATWRAEIWRRFWRKEVRLLGELGRVRHVRRANWAMPLTTRGRSVEAARWIAQSALPSSASLNLAHPDAAGPYVWRLLASRARIIGRRRLWSWRQRAQRKH